MKHHLLLLIVLMGFLPAPATKALEVGVAKTSILPDTPVFIAGYDNNRLSEGVLDTLHARCLVLRDAKQKALVVALDVVGLFWEDVEAARNRLKALGFAPSQVLIASTHTHSGPDTLGLWGPKESISGRNKAYMEKLFGGILSCAKNAQAKAQPVEMGLAKGDLKEICHNVRKGDEQKQDHQALLIRFRSLKTKKDVGTIVNYGCHPESMNIKKLTSDVAGQMAEMVEKDLGAPVVFLNGILGGMITPKGTDGTWPSTIQKARQWADQILTISKTTTWEKPSQWFIKQRQFKLPVVNPRFILASAAGVVERPMRLRAARTELMWLKLGSLSLLTIPGEPLPEFGLAMKGLLKSPYKGIVGLGNDELGYLIPESAFDPKRYEESMSLGPKTATYLFQEAQGLLQE